MVSAFCITLENLSCLHDIKNSYMLPSSTSHVLHLLCDPWLLMSVWSEAWICLSPEGHLAEKPFIVVALS